MASSFSAVIIAAGMGNRLSPFTDDLPKCMLPFAGRPLIEHQIAALKAAGVGEISVVRGHKGDRISVPGVSYFENTNYRDNNILESLMCAEAALNGDVICLYSDILFDAGVVDQLFAQSRDDICVVVDTDWRDYYVGRADHPVSEAEGVVFDGAGNIALIGKIGSDVMKLDGEFIGMMKLTDRGAKVFKEHYHRARARYWDRSFQRAKVFQKAYLTDQLQEMVDQGIAIGCARISKGWKEIDTVEDYTKAVDAMKQLSGAPGARYR